MVVGKIKTLIFGAGGMLGTELCEVFPDAVKLKQRDLDIRDREKVIETIETNKPDVVINAAGYTAVDDCEDNRELAFDINGAAPGYIAQGCKRAGAILVHYSTDYIFDGARKEYVESDLPNPINEYGRSKLIGETNIIKNMDNYRIIRTSWLYGAHGKNFVDTMLTLSGKMDKVKVVNDQFGKPTYAVDLARKTKELVGLLPGVYHITNDGVCSWYELASAIINNIVPCTSDELPRKAKRPKYSALVNTKTTPLRHWKDALAEYLKPREVYEEHVVAGLKRNYSDAKKKEYLVSKGKITVTDVTEKSSVYENFKLGRGEKSVINNYLVNNIDLIISDDEAFLKILDNHYHFLK